jgi:hypothetical protein
MRQPSPLYGTPAALSLIDPWLCEHLPDLDPRVRRQFIQLVSGIFESRSLLIEAIAATSPFPALPHSNATGNPLGGAGFSVTIA